MTHLDVRDGADHELALARVFVELAHGLADEVDLQDVLSGLTEHCVDLLDAVACGILLTDPDGKLAVLAAHPESAAVLELLQVQIDQGPCVDCLHSGQPVRSGDLAADVDRWSTWAPMALEHGIASVYATPLRTRDTVFGTLNLFDRSAHTMSGPDLLIVRALADVATVTILQQRRTQDAGQLNRQLQTALDSRIRIEQAKGIIAHALGVNTNQAFQILRHNSRSTNVKLTALCQHLISGRITPADLLRIPGPAAAPTPA